MACGWDCVGWWWVGALGLGRRSAWGWLVGCCVVVVEAVCDGACFLPCFIEFIGREVYALNCADAVYAAHEADMRKLTSEASSISGVIRLAEVVCGGFAHCCSFLCLEHCSCKSCIISGSVAFMVCVFFFLFKLSNSIFKFNNSIFKP